MASGVGDGVTGGGGVVVAAGVGRGGVIVGCGVERGWCEVVHRHDARIKKIAVENGIRRIDHDVVERNVVVELTKKGGGEIKTEAYVIIGQPVPIAQ